MAFSELLNKTKNSNLLVFFDFEGTQITHKAIAIGLVAYERKGDSFDFSKPKYTYSSLIKTDDEIGEVVKKMTGITEEKLLSSGKDFHSVVLDITKILRNHIKTYISYGGLDIKILHETIDEDDETEMNFYKNVKNHYIDFHQYLSKRIIDDKGQSLSIEKLTRLYSIKQKGTFHDPLYDAKELSSIYHAYLENEDLDLKHYKSKILKNPFSDMIFKEVVEKILQEKSISEKDFDEILRNHL